MSGLELPSRVKHFKIRTCDGSGVCLQFGYANGDGSNTERISLNLPAAPKLSSELTEAVDEYLYNTGEAIIEEEIPGYGR